jgi:hypothetical protein
MKSLRLRNRTFRHAVAPMTRSDRVRTLDDSLRRRFWKSARSRTFPFRTCTIVIGSIMGL